MYPGSYMEWARCCLLFINDDVMSPGDLGGDALRMQSRDEYLTLMRRIVSIMVFMMGSVAPPPPRGDAVDADDEAVEWPHEKGEVPLADL